VTRTFRFDVIPSPMLTAIASHLLLPHDHL